MSQRTLAPAPPQDRRFWRLLLRRAHPDAGGSHDLFLWTQSVREYVASGASVEPPPRARRQLPQHPPNSACGDRVDYSPAFEKYGSFIEVTQAALLLGETLQQPVSGLLALLDNCAARDVGEDDPIQHRAQHVGATYRSLASLAYKAGFTKAERVQLYRVAERVPLSQRHCGHLHKRLAEQGERARLAPPALDCGDLCASDRRENEYALDKRLRIFSACDTPAGKVYVIT